MTIQLHGTVAITPGESARLRTAIGDFTVPREVFAGVPVGEHEGEFAIRRLYLKAVAGEGYLLVLQCAEVERHTFESTGGSARAAG